MKTKKKKITKKQSYYLLKTKEETSYLVTFDNILLMEAIDLGEILF